MHFPVCLSEYVFEFVLALPECVCASVCVYARVPESLSLSVLASASFPLWQTIHLSLCVSVCVSVCLCVCMSVCLSYFVCVRTYA